jgi:hypothetical protein
MYHTLRVSKRVFYLKTLFFLTFIVASKISYAQTFTSTELPIHSCTPPKYNIDKNNNIHMLYCYYCDHNMLYYRNNIGNQKNTFNDSIFIDETEIMLYYQIEFDSNNNPFFIYGYTTDEYDPIEDKCFYRYTLKSARFDTDSNITINTIFSSRDYTIFDFDTKKDSSGVFHACFVVDSLNASHKNVYYVYDLLGENKKLTQIFNNMNCSSVEIQIDCMDTAHVFCKQYNKPKETSYLLHTVPQATSIKIDTIDTFQSYISFMSSKNNKGVISVAYIKDSLYYAQLNNNTWQKDGLFSDNNINSFSIGSFIISDSTIIIVAGFYKDTSIYITTHIEDPSKIITVPFFNNSNKTISLSLDNAGFIYGILNERNNDYENTNYAINSKLALASLPTLPPTPPIINDINTCAKESIHLNISGIDLKWYSDSELKNKIFQGDSIKISCWRTGTFDYYLTETILGIVSEPTKFSIKVNPLPKIELGTDKTMGTKDTLVLTAGSDFTSYLWQDGEDKQYYTVYGNTLDTGQYKYSVSVSDSNSCYNSDSILITVYSSDPDILLKSVTNYPNPVHDFIIIDFKDFKANIEFSLIDSDGKIIFYYNSFVDGTEYIDVSKIDKGIYYLKIQIEGSAIIKPIIKL